MIMRATQKKMMSGAVTSVLVGKKYRRSSAVPSSLSHGQS